MQHRKPVRSKIVNTMRIAAGGTVERSLAKLAYFSDVSSGCLDLVVPNGAVTAACVADSDVVIERRPRPRRQST